MPFIFGLLRIMRAMIGFVGALNLLSACSLLANAAERGIIKLAIAFVCLSLFGMIGWIINRLHLNRHGIPHPALAKTWSL